VNGPEGATIIATMICEPGTVGKYGEHAWQRHAKARAMHVCCVRHGGDHASSSTSHIQPALFAIPAQCGGAGAAA
jgi:hypothetical protein